MMTPLFRFASFHFIFVFLRSSFAGLLATLMMKPSYRCPFNPSAFLLGLLVPLAMNRRSLSFSLTPLILFCGNFRVTLMMESSFDFVYCFGASDEGTQSMYTSSILSWCSIAMFPATGTGKRWLVMMKPSLRFVF